MIRWSEIIGLYNLSTPIRGNVVWTKISLFMVIVLVVIDGDRFDCNSVDEEVACNR